MQATQYNSGVYRSYAEFLVNTPSVSNFYIEIKKKKVDVYEIKADSSRVPIENPWRLCKDGEVYNASPLRLVRWKRAAMLL